MPAELDDRRFLLNLLGSFWADTYQGSDLVGDLLHARAQVEIQADVDAAELLATVSRHTVPVFHIDNWYALDLLESQRNLADANLVRLDGSRAFGTFSWDVPVETAYHVWQLPTDLHQVRLLMGRVGADGPLLVQGTDFFLKDGAVWFRDNPFSRADVALEDVLTNGSVTDRRCRLWVYRGQWDRDEVYRQFGYAVGLHYPSSFNYRVLVNAAYDSLCEGPIRRSFDRALSAATDVPLADGDETVTGIFTDRRARWIVTDRRVYRLHLDAVPSVAVGAKLTAGDSLCDALTVYEFNRGTLPTGLRALVVGLNVLAGGYASDLVFENKDVPLLVTPNVDGYTKVSFTLGGRPADVDKFWDDVHAAGVAKGQTLAMLLDQRSNKTEQPTARALPATINPLGFLVANVWRQHAFAVVVKPHLLGRDALGLGALRVLRRLLPPHVACLLVVQLAITGDQIIMDGPGEATRPGYLETVTTFLGRVVDETIDPAAYISERVRCYHVRGQCV